MKVILSCFLLFIALITFSQTDIIEMKSRNASLKNYSRLRVSNRYHLPSNFGNPPEIGPIVLTPAVFLDSVKKIENNHVVFFIREQCGKPLDSIDPNNVMPCPSSTDTIYNHPLFRHNASLDSIKTVFKRDYSMGLIVDSTQFIDFDSTGSIHSEETIPMKRKKKENSLHWELLFMIITPIAFFLGMNKLKIVR